MKIEFVSAKPFYYRGRMCARGDVLDVPPRDAHALCAVKIARGYVEPAAPAAEDDAERPAASRQRSHREHQHAHAK